MSEIERLERTVHRLREMAHEAPLNPLRTDADGHRWVAMNSDAWARFSREYFAAVAALRKARGEQS